VPIDRRGHTDPVKSVRSEDPTRIRIIGPNGLIGPQIIEDGLPPFQNHISRESWFIALIQVDAGVAPRNLRELVKGTKRSVVVEEGGIEPSYQIGYKNDNHVVNMDLK